MLEGEGNKRFMIKTTFVVFTMKHIKQTITLDLLASNTINLAYWRE